MVNHPETEGHLSSADPKASSETKLLQRVLIKLLLASPTTAAPKGFRDVPL